MLSVFKLFFDRLPVPSCILRDNRLLMANEKMAEITGYTVEELLRTPYSDLLHPADRSRAMEGVSLCLDGREQGETEIRVIGRRGKEIHLTCHFARVDLDGVPALLVQGVDITRRKRQEAEIRESEEKYRLLLESIEDGFYEVDLAGNLLQCNDSMARIYGVEDWEPFVGMNYRNYMDRESAAAVFDAFKKIYLTGGAEKGLILEITRRDGSKRILEISVSLTRDKDGNPSGFSGIVRDVTERRKAEERLQLNEARLETLLKLNQMTSASLKEIADFALEEGVRLTGSSIGFLAFVSEDESVLTMHSWSIQAMKECSIDDKSFVCPVETSGLWAEAVRQRRPVILNDYSRPNPMKKGHPDGHVRLRRVMCVPVFDGGKIVAVAGVANKKDDYDNSDADQLVLLMSGMWRIIQRRQAEETLRASEERFSKAFNASPVSMSIQEFSSGRYIDVNETFLRESGFGREEVIGRTPGELGIYDFAGIGRAFLEKGTVRNFEITLRFKSGRPRIGLLNIEAIDVGGKRCLLSSFYDITERKMIEDQLKYLSLHDSLTGLYNRVYFEEEMRRLEKSRSGRVGIIVCDVDGLKSVNDTMGHAAGDELLVAAARVFRESFRESDMVSRIGGDEFAILLPNCSRAAVEKACRRIQNAIARYNEENQGLPLSISIGFATGEVPANLAELFREADNNMYREKLHRSQSARSALVQTLMKALEARDFITEGHADRLQDLVASVARSIGLPDHRISDLCLLAQFHDIGKVGIPDRILFKPGPLTSREVAEMRRHCEIGYFIAISPPDLMPVADWILKHHEWWNGKGYPLGLKGEEIPLECRILAIADAYDAMTNDRPYRKAMSHKEAVAELKKCAGTQFDPDLVPLFIKIVEGRKLKK